MSGRRSRTRRALSAVAEGRSSSLAPYARSADAEGSRRSLAPYALRSLAPHGGSADTPPPMVDGLPLPSWPPLQIRRDRVERSIVQILGGPCVVRQRYSAVPKPEAKRAAADIEAEAYAAASEYASGATLASAMERFEVFKIYCKEFCVRSHRFLKSREATLGGVREQGDSPVTALALAASTSEE